MSLINKYYTDNIDKIVGNAKNIRSIIDWLEHFSKIKDFLLEHKLLKKSTKGRKKKVDGLTEIENEYMKMKSCLVISGPHGCGKTTIVNLLLKNYNIINLNELREHVTIDSELIKNMHNNLPDQKNIILVDDWESVIVSNDKKGIVDIIKNNNYNRWMPMIVITNNEHDKQMTNIKKCSNEVKFYHPWKSEIKHWLYLICKNENINIEYDLLEVIIDYCQNDLRKILTFIDEIYINHKNKYINQNAYNELIKTIGKDTKSLDLFKATEHLLTTYENLNNCLDLYKTDKTVVPLMIFENYHKYTESHSIIMDKISLSDIFESYIFCEQNWDLLDIHGLISCGIPSYYINKYTNNNKNQKLIYATDLNKASVMRMNKKNKSGTSNLKTSKNDTFTFKKENTKKKREETTKLFLDKQKNSDKTITDFMYINDIVENLF